MVDAISSVNSLNSKRCEKPQLAFKGEQAPVDMEQKPDTFEKENEVAQTTEEKQGMTRGKKIAIGVGALIGLVAAGFGIKKGLDIKAANNALKEAAQALGITDMKLYNNLKSVFENMTVFERENLEYPDIIKKVAELAKQGKIADGDKLLIMNHNSVEEMLAKTFKTSTNIPENTIAIAIESAGGKEIKYSELIFHNGLYDGLVDLLPKDKIYAVPIKV